MDLITPILDRILTEITPALSPTPGRSLLVPGTEVVWDDCCDGQVWVRIISILPSGNPYPQNDYQQKCGPVVWAVTLGLGVVRCVATVNDDGSAPDTATLTAEAEQIIVDATTLEQAIRSMEPELPMLRFVQWRPLGPEGGCAGGEWEIIVAAQVC